MIYALVHYLKKEGALGVREDVDGRRSGPKTTSSSSSPTATPASNQVVVPGREVDPKRDADGRRSRRPTKGFAFASATWHFSTEKLPAEERGDFFSVSRSYFQRETDRARAAC